jgi:hypothetical protein
VGFLERNHLAEKSYWTKMGQKIHCDLFKLVLHGTPKVDLGLIVSHCVYLKKLVLQEILFSNNTTNIPVVENCPLKEFDLKCMEFEDRQQCDPPKAVLKAILAGAKKLETLSIGIDSSLLFCRV